MNNHLATAFRSIVSLAATHLPKDVYEHSLRVMLYVMSNTDIPTDMRDECILTAITHDLLEDSIVTLEDLPSMPEHIVDAILLLTKEKHVHYVEYIRRIVASRGKYYGNIAYWVKLADMKDHLAQKDTLTDKLRTKYMEALPYLLP